jgi:mycofactocin system glycosyltransferase
VIPPAPGDRLPDGYAVRLDPRTRVRDGGTALLGGSPLRLVRLSAAAQRMLRGDRLVVRDAGTAALAARLLDGGLAHPDLPPDRTAGGVTVVVPVKDRTGPLDRLLTAVRGDPDTAGADLVVLDDGSADPAAVAAVTARHGGRLVRHETARGPAAARNAGLARATTELVAFLDSDCVPRPGWLPPLRAHLADPRLAAVAPRIRALHEPRGWLAGYESLASALDMGGRPAPVRPWSAVSYVPSAALLVRRAALGEGFDPSMPVAEDVDLVWRLHRAGWRVRYEPRSAVAHDHPDRLPAWLRRRAAYGTGAALLAARHGAAVAPVVVSPWSATAWTLAVAGGRAGRAAAAGVLAVATARLARRLAPAAGPPPLGLAAVLALRGTGAAGRTLARAATRHHWPLALAVAAVSGRARRRLAVVAAADALAAWWPHRRAIDPARFALARRLDDLGYGAGLWWGALRAGSPRALLPARPPSG